MIDGYAFIDGQPQACIVLDEPLTKRDIVERGWASYPARILTDPSTQGFEGPVFVNEKEAEKAVSSGIAFKIGKWFYALNHNTPTRASKFEQPYWTENGSTDNYLIGLISAALSAPTIDHECTPYRFFWRTGGGERVDAVAWDYDVVHGKHDDALDWGVVIERSLLPGVGYGYAVETTTYVDPPYDGENAWPASVATSTVSPYFDITINFPNCELGPNTCVTFRLEEKSKKVPSAALPGALLARKLTSCNLTKHTVYFPKKIRRLPMPRFQPRTSTDAVSCYVMSRQSVKDFVNKLYTKDIYDKVKSMLYGDGAGNILSLKWFYGIRPAISTPQTRRITLGNYVFDISVPVFAGDFTQVYMGSALVGKVFSDYRDYTNVRIRVFVPMVGMIDLDPSMVMGKTVHLLYTINLTDGSAVVTLSTTETSGPIAKENGWYETDNVIFTTSITYGYEIPLNVDSIRSASLTVGEIVTKAVVGGGVGAIAGNIPGAVLGAIGGAASAALDNTAGSYSSGSLTPNSNVMGDFKPKLYRIYNEDVSGNISALVGRPSGKVVRVGEASGYLKAAMVYGTPSSTMQHADEIVNILKEGIYIS